MLDGTSTTDSTHPPDSIRRNTAEQVSATSVSPATRYYVLFVLMLVGTMCTLDRQIVNILVEPIRRDLALNDTQMGFLTGMAFTLVFVTMCIPAARLADRWSRSKVIAVAMTIWSIMTLLCGVAQNATQLFIARFGVGFGEAGGSAPSHALVGDIFPRHQRATAMAILVVSASLGMGLGLFLGGRSLDAFGWRTTFFLAGLPGLFLVPLLLFTFPKVPRGMVDGADPTRPNESFLSTVRILWSIKAMPNMMLAATLQTVVSTGMLAWIPAFLSRSHGLDHSTIGAKLGLSLGLGSLLGHLAGGPLADLLGRRDLRWHLWVPAITAPITGCLAVIALKGSVELVFPLLGVLVMISALSSGPLLAITMNLAPVTARATASACLYLVINAVGLGLGPQIVGIISDLFRPAFGEQSLRMALLCASTVVIPASYFFYQASRSYLANMKQIDAINKNLV
jgi:MFS family permease